MIRRILSISGRPGLYKLVNQGKNMLIVESLADGHRFPAYARDKVVALADISIYTQDEDRPLTEVLEAIKTKKDAQPIEYKELGDAELRDLFGELVEDYDRDRVRTSDIKKLLSWYNQLVAAGITEFVEKADEAAPESAE